MSDRPKRVLVIAAEPPWPVTNGVRTKVSGLVQHIGYPVDLISPASADAPPPGVVQSWNQLPPLPGSPSRLAALRRGQLPICGLLPPHLVLPIVHGLIQEGSRYDIVHFDTMATLHLVPSLRKSFASNGQRPMLVASLNDSYSLLLASGGLNNRIHTRLYGRYVRRVEQRILPDVDFADVVSEADLAWLRKAVPNGRFRLVPLAIDAVAFSGPRPTPVWDLLYVGTMCAKAFFWLKQALDSILPVARGRVPHLRVATAGPDATDVALRYFESHGVHHLGFVPDLSDLLRSSRMLLVSSRQRAGTPTKALQAMAAGTPVVGVEALLGIPNGRDHVTFSLARNWADLAERVVQILTSDAYALELASGGLRLVRRQHDWPVVLERYLNFSNAHISPPGTARDGHTPGSE